MSFIRGKIHPEREVVAKEITFGEPSFYFCERCKLYVDANTHEQVEVKVTTLGDILDEVCKPVSEMARQALDEWGKKK